MLGRLPSSRMTGSVGGGRLPGRAFGLGPPPGAKTPAAGSRGLLSSSSIEPLSSSIIGSFAGAPLPPGSGAAAEPGAFFAAASASISGGAGRPIVVGRLEWSSGPPPPAGAGAAGPAGGSDLPELGAGGGIEFAFTGSGT